MWNLVFHPTNWDCLLTLSYAFHFFVDKIKVKLCLRSYPADFGFYTYLTNNLWAISSNLNILLLLKSLQVFLGFVIGLGILLGRFHPYKYKVTEDIKAQNQCYNKIRHLSDWVEYAELSENYEYTCDINIFRP